MEQVPGIGPVKLEGNEKLAVEFGPLAFLLGGYILNGTLGPILDGLFGTELFAGDEGRLYTGLLLFMPAFTVAFAYSVYRTRRIVPLLAVTGALVIGLGAMTFFFQDKRFFYVKPTIVYGITSLALGGGLLAGRNFLKILFDGAFEMEEAAWRTFTWRFVIFNLLMAVANEALWRTLIPMDKEGWWLAIKGLGFTIAYFGFIAANAPFLMKHATIEEKTRS